ncbi:MAG TPA: hypothetical protein VGO37_07745 [Steroidobacteraceae bacterium]|nr:hypothetical protein [Steroidobacteraceae bacterium]
MSKIAAAFLLALLLSAAAPAFAGEQLVLIVSSRSNIDQLDSPLVRRLFLGLTVTQHGTRLRPLLNESDTQLKDIFLQNIVSMSDSTYDRYLLQLSLKQGRTQPMVYRENAQVISSVAADPAAVSYAWLKDVERDSRIRILRVVWHD